MGKRSVALNIGYLKPPDSYTHADVEVACEVLLRALSGLWRRWPRSRNDALFNVTVPIGCSSDAKIFTCPVFHQSYGRLYAPIRQQKEKEEEEEVEFVFDKLKFDPNPPEGTDRWALVNGHVSITVLKPRFYEPKSVSSPFPRLIQSSSTAPTSNTIN